MALLQATEKNAIPAVKSLIKNLNANVNAKNTDGHTPFMIAAYHGYAELLEYLTTVPEININARSNTGMNALMLATYKGRTECIPFLLNIGMDLNAVDGFKRTALDFALEGNHIEASKLLLFANGFAKIEGSKLILNEEGISAIKQAKEHFGRYKFLYCYPGTTLKEVLEIEGDESNWEEFSKDLRPSRPNTDKTVLSQQEFYSIKSSVLTSNVGTLISDVNSLFKTPLITTTNNAESLSDSRLITTPNHPHESQTSILDGINDFTKVLTLGSKLMDVVIDTLKIYDTHRYLGTSSISYKTILPLAIDSLYLTSYVYGNHREAATAISAGSLMGKIIYSSFNSETIKSIAIDSLTFIAPAIIFLYQPFDDVSATLMKTAFSSAALGIASYSTYQNYLDCLEKHEQLKIQAYNNLFDEYQKTSTRNMNTSMECFNGIDQYKENLICFSGKGHNVFIYHFVDCEDGITSGCLSFDGSYF